MTFRFDPNQGPGPIRAAYVGRAPRLKASRPILTVKGGGVKHERKQERNRGQNGPIGSQQRGRPVFVRVTVLCVKMILGNFMQAPLPAVGHRRLLASFQRATPLSVQRGVGPREGDTGS